MFPLATSHQNWNAQNIRILAFSRFRTFGFWHSTMYLFDVKNKEIVQDSVSKPEFQGALGFRCRQCMKSEQIICPKSELFGNETKTKNSEIQTFRFRTPTVSGFWMSGFQKFTVQ